MPKPTKSFQPKIKVKSPSAGTVTALRTTVPEITPSIHVKSLVTFLAYCGTVIEPGYNGSP